MGVSLGIFRSDRKGLPSAWIFIHPIPSYHHLSSPILMKVDIQSPCYYEPLRGGQDCFVRSVILFRVTDPREGSTLRGEEHATAKSILVGGEVRRELLGIVCIVCDPKCVIALGVEGVSSMVDLDASCSRDFHWRQVDCNAADFYN